MNHRQQYNEES